MSAEQDEWENEQPAAKRKPGRPAKSPVEPIGVNIAEPSPEELRAALKNSLLEQVNKKGYDVYVIQGVLRQLIGELL